MNAKDEISVTADIKEDVTTASAIEDKKGGDSDVLTDSSQAPDSASLVNNKLGSSGMMSKSRLMANPSALLMSMKHNIN
ncbi:hypothetical protein HK407_12g18470 [Ordospora pajunii]|uniref:uncharacterized protein n=1 Tax=Ordospora pajunii TaxID=3039483 RepID=UPI0029527C90|nr:uncharacterized protein HK407_12g18470 [Ordospora pajunii]KAH9410715.1 hypothetical protein HK407_12g18470 [Ordospora pajunii]